MPATKSSRLPRASRGTVGLLAVLLGLLLVGSAAAQSGIGAFVQDRQPSVVWGGRSVAVDADRRNPDVAIVASDTGGLYKTENGGATWRHIDSLLPFVMGDVRFDPSDPSIVIATVVFDSHAAYRSRIWRSTDGGETWDPSDPAQPPAGCGARVGAWGISFDPHFTGDVYVGTDCGLAVSRDHGATWQTVDPAPRSANDAVYAVVAHPIKLGVVDTCGANGHHRGRWTDVGGTQTLVWTQLNDLPGGLVCLPGWVHAIDVGPNLVSDDLYVTPSDWNLYGSDDVDQPGPTTWTNLNAATGTTNKPPFVRAYLSPNLKFNEYDLYYGTGSGPPRDSTLLRQRCTVSRPAKLACSTSASSWLSVGLNTHADASDLAFDIGPACPRYLSSDGGVAVQHRLGALETAVTSESVAQQSMEVLGLAMTAAGLGRDEDALRLEGAVDAKWKELGLSFTSPFFDAWRERDLGAARARLGESRADTAFDEGRAMTWDQAVELALGRNSAT